MLCNCSRSDLRQQALANDASSLHDGTRALVLVTMHLHDRCHGASAFHMRACSAQRTPVRYSTVRHGTVQYSTWKLLSLASAGGVCTRRLLQASRALQGQGHSHIQSSPRSFLEPLCATLPALIRLLWICRTCNSLEIGNIV